MSQSNISSVNISDTLGMNVGLSNEGEIGILSSHLKLFLQVTSTNSVSNGNTLTIPTSNGSNFKKVTINFNNGVYYDLQISGNYLQIYTSDLDKTVDYTLDSTAGDKIHTILGGY